MVLDPSRGNSFRRLVFRAAVLPTILMLGLAVVLVIQIQQLIGASAWVEHSDQVMTDANQLLRLYVDMETGLRGFLLTHDRLFLEPYEKGLADAAPLTADLKSLVTDNATQSERVVAIADAGAAWVGYSKQEVAAAAGRQAADVLERAKAGKTGMDRIRVRFADLIEAEEGLRAARSIDARRAAQRGVWIACGAAVVVGTVLGLAARRELGRLARSYSDALATAEALTADLERRVVDRTAELGKVNEALTEANRELEAFGYSISHDLRAPMRHISGFADLLRMSLGQTLSPDDSENLTTIGDTARLAGKMVDDLLSFSRIGRVELRRETVDMDALVARAWRELAPEAGGREIAWNPGRLPPATGDASLLKLAVVNLLGNALKYSSKSERPAIDVTGTLGGDGTATYAVRDNGVGFDMAYAHKLFGVFQRLHRAEEYEGTGIGLANARRIIVRHGGRIRAEGRPGAGATFFFSLPTAATTEATTEAH